MSRFNFTSWMASTFFCYVLSGIFHAGPEAAPFAYIPNTGDDTVSVIDIATNTVVDTIVVGANPIGVAWHPNGSRIYIANNGADGNNNTISVIDPATNVVIDEFVVGPGPEGLTVHPDGKRLYVNTPGLHFLPPDCVLGDEVAVVNITNDINTVMRTIAVGDHPWGILADPEGDFVYVTNAHTETLSIIDSATNTIDGDYNLGDGCDTGVDNHPVGMIKHPTQEILYIAHMHASKLSEFDLTTRTITRQVDMSIGECPDLICKHAHGLTITPDGSTIYATLFFSSEVAVVDTASFSVTTLIPVGESERGPKGIDISPDASTLYVANQFDDAVYVIDTASQTVVQTIPVGSGPIAFGKFIGPSSVVDVSPVIATVTPRRLAKSSSNTVNVLGNNFINSLTFEVTPADSGISVGRISVTSSTRMRAIVTVDADANSGSYNLTVTNPDGNSSTLNRAFSVTR
ncbi:MAG: YVTN family beta-propeller protein [Paraglaciecola sp.]|jgi:YVTN family beta-propeller protein